MGLVLVPIDKDEADFFIKKHHRHHKPTVGWKFGIGACLDREVVGIIVVGRPVARHYDDGMTLEVTRCCTDGTKNAASFLYGAAWRACKDLGYRRMITYTLNTEPGTSLKAAGWKLIGERGGGSWSREGRPRVDTHPLQRKLLWEAA